jgi:hypothetical protein
MKEKDVKNRKLWVPALLMVAALMLNGCAGLFPNNRQPEPSSTTTAYRTFAGVKIGVETAMNVWADRVIAGKATAAQEAQVKAAYEAYQAAYVAAIHQAVNDQAAAPADVTAASLKLLNLLATFGVKS